MFAVGSDRMRGGGPRGGLCTAILAAVLLAACANRASAQSGASEETYARVIRDALAEFDAGHFPEARALFEQAHALRPSARTFRGLGVADFELRSYVQAVNELEQALADTRNPLTADQRREVQGVIERARRYTGAVRIEVTPQDAQLVIDGSVVRGRELALNAGEHLLSARAEGYKLGELKFSLEGQREETLRIDLVPVSLRTPAPALATQSLNKGEPAHDTILKKWWFWTAVGVVVAGGVTAGAIAISSDKGGTPVAPKTGVVVTTLGVAP